MDLVRFIIRRLAAGIVLLLVVSLVIFVACEFLPGDVAEIMLGQSASPENVQALRVELGLDKPSYLRFLAWIWGMFHADWGISLTTRLPVADMLSERLANTLVLAGLTTLVAVPLALGLGIVLAVRKGTKLDRFGTVAIVGLCSTPEFLVATVGVLVFAIHLHWLPAISYLSPGQGVFPFMKSILLPFATMTIIIGAQIARMTRAIVGDILTQPYVEMARLKGASGTRVVVHHVLRNAVGPLVNIVSLNVAYLVSGVVIVETIFAYPGLARLMADSVLARDLPVVQSCAIIFCAAYIALIMLADIIAHLSDSRAKDGAIS
ncbi:ABC transporter permease (plasmid) [Bosea vestrisii]|uniref:ABC transporter permease n=1 Tax=Bosea vestrisii TaxID=151416 RepID=UPI0024DF328E|nr:ABC transporter permease [Bosea vestrisii]WID99931.1 ABC transporter permease [Bosea vestrisii]